MPTGAHRTRRILLIGLLVWGSLTLAVDADGPVPTGRAYIERYVGSASCRECHLEFFTLWSTSAHGRSFLPVDREFISEFLTPQTGSLKIRGARWQVRLGAEQAFLAEIRQADARHVEHVLRYAVGGTNVYFFVTLRGKGRWQVLPVGYDIRRRQWYDITTTMLRHHGDTADQPVDWTDRAFTWNVSCFGCHVSQAERGYSRDSNGYESRWLEGGINCETCHGPGGMHIRAMRESDGQTPRDIHLIQPRKLDRERSDSLCASCHALATPLTASFVPGERFADHFDLAGLERADFYPDGRARGETYTYASYLLSTCVSTGNLRCIHCHTPSGRLRVEHVDTDQLCMACHRALLEDVSAHTHHTPESDGSRCIACHMPVATFARMPRHDHSFLPPAPRASLKFGSPNACNDCHSDRGAAWADGWVRKWYPRDYQGSVLKRGRLVEVARKQEWERLPDIVKYVSDPAHNELVRASLIRLLSFYGGAEKWPVLIAQTRDSSRWVRAAAVARLIGCQQPGARDALITAARDGYRTVRMYAALALSAHSLDDLSKSRTQIVHKVFREYEALAADHPDEPDWQSNLGIFHQNRDDPVRAEAAYEQALRLRPTDLTSLVNLSRLYARQDRLKDSETVLLKAARAHPDSSAVHYSLGLLYAELGRLAPAEVELRRALEIDPRHAGAAYNLAGVLGQSERFKEALTYSRLAAALRPDDPRNQEALEFYRSRAGSRE